MMQIGKWLIVSGLVLIGLGVLWQGASFLGLTQKLGKLPGDLRWEGKNFSFYFPLSTSILLSVLLSLFFYLWGRFKS